MKRAIITFGVGYGYDELKYFIHSCYEHAEGADVYIYVGKNISDLRESFSGYTRVHFIRYREALMPKVMAKIFKSIPGVAEDYAKVLRKLYLHDILSKTFLQSLTTPLVQFMVKRFFLIRQLLSTLPHEQVMLTDIRDVLLMGDPFQSVTDNTIITGVEPVTTAECELNRKWFMNTYSPVKLKRVAQKPVACAGVTIGSRKAIDQYVDEMIIETYRHLHKIIGMLGADQAIHIQLFYHGLKGLEKRFEANGTGQIATLHFSRLSEFSIHHGKIENKQPVPLAVVHQYDRHEALAKNLKTYLDERIRRKMAAA